VLRAGTCFGFFPKISTTVENTVENVATSAKTVLFARVSAFIAVQTLWSRVILNPSQTLVSSS
jgi:hypothetical protein